MIAQVGRTSVKGPSLGRRRPIRPRASGTDPGRAHTLENERTLRVMRGTQMCQSLQQQNDNLLQRVTTIGEKARRHTDGCSWRLKGKESTRNFVAFSYGFVRSVSEWRRP